jgi:hypothetical protein
MLKSVFAFYLRMHLLFAGLEFRDASPTD